MEFKKVFRPRSALINTILRSETSHTYFLLNMNLITAMYVCTHAYKPEAENDMFFSTHKEIL